MSELTMSLAYNGERRPNGEPSNPGNPWRHDEWTVTLAYEGRTMEVTYRTGLGLRVDGSPASPSLATVMDSIVSDYRVTDECSDVADYADEYGFDTVRELLATWSALQTNRTDMANLFGDSIGEVLAYPWSDSDATESVELNPATVRVPPETLAYIPFAIMDDGETLCTRCVADESNPIHGDAPNDGWRLIGWDHSGNVDTEPVICAHCSRVIVEGYGDA